VLDDQLAQGGVATPKRAKRELPFSKQPAPGASSAAALPQIWSALPHGARFSALRAAGLVSRPAGARAPRIQYPPACGRASGGSRSARTSFIASHCWLADVTRVDGQVGEAGESATGTRHHRLLRAPPAAARGSRSGARLLARSPTSYVAEPPPRLRRPHRVRFSEQGFAGIAAGGEYCDGAVARHQKRPSWASGREDRDVAAGGSEPTRFVGARTVGRSLRGGRRRRPARVRCDASRPDNGHRPPQARARLRGQRALRGQRGAQRPEGRSGPARGSSKHIVARPPRRSH